MKDSTKIPARTYNRQLDDCCSNKPGEGNPRKPNVNKNTHVTRDSLKGPEFLIIGYAYKLDENPTSNSLMGKRPKAVLFSGHVGRKVRPPPLTIKL